MKTSGLIKIASLSLIYFTQLNSAVSDEISINISTPNPELPKSLVIPFPALGLFRDCNAAKTATTSVLIRDVDTDFEITVRTKLAALPRWDQNVNDLDNPGQTTDRCKFFYNQSHVYTVAELSNRFPPLGDRRYDASFIGSFKNTPWSVPAESAGQEYAEVEFRGGNNQQPLGIFLENGINFSDLNLTGLASWERLELQFLHSGVEASPPQHLESITTYNQNGTPNKTTSPDINFTAEGFYISTPPSSNTDTKIGLLPGFFQTTDNFPLTKPTSGWYKIIPVACINQHRACRPLPHTVNSDVVTPAIYYTYDGLMARALLTRGPTYAKTDDNVTYKEIIPLIVKSVGAGGGIRLQNWVTDGNFNRGALTKFDLSSTPNSDEVANGNRVRWFSRSGSANVLHTGRIGWVASDGSYAFLKKDNLSSPFPANGKMLILEQHITPSSSDN